MVVRNTFIGEINDTNLNNTENINLNLLSDTQTTSITHYPIWSKHFLNSIYQTLIDAGYSPTKSETDYSIEIWGFKFHVLVQGDTYYRYAQIYIKGFSDSINEYRSSTMFISSSQNGGLTKYSYILTIRGSEDMFFITMGGVGFETNEYELFYLAQARYTPTGEDSFACGQRIAGSPFSGKLGISCCLKSNLYNIKFSSLNKSGTNDKLMIFMITENAYNNDYGIGVGYPKIPAFTPGFEFLIKGFIFTNKNSVTSGNYYKLGNEIYYAHFSSASTVYPYLYKVDTVPEETIIEIVDKVYN